MPSPQNARRRCALSISSSVDVVAFISPGQPGRTATNTYDFASGRAVAGDDPVNESDPSGLYCAGPPGHQGGTCPHPIPGPPAPTPTATVSTSSSVYVGGQVEVPPCDFACYLPSSHYTFDLLGPFSDSETSFSVLSGGPLHVYVADALTFPDTDFNVCAEPTHDCVANDLVWGNTMRSNFPSDDAIADVYLAGGHDVLNSEYNIDLTAEVDPLPAAIAAVLGGGDGDSPDPSYVVGVGSWNNISSAVLTAAVSGSPCSNQTGGTYA